MELLTDILLLIAGFVLLIKGADFFVDGSIGVAERFGIPHLIIGLTVVALGTSAPEGAVSIMSALRGSGDLTIGNVLGSNIFNILMILGFTAMVSPLVIKYEDVKKQIAFLCVISLMFIVMGYDGSLGLVEGIILTALLVLFILFLILDAKKAQLPDEPDVIEEKNVQRKLGIDILLILGGSGAILWGSDLAVDSATSLALSMGVSQRIVGLTVIAFGTSLPELATSLVAAMKGNTDIAIGNIVGSNVFNLLFVAGATALITTVPFNSEFIFDAGVALVAAILLIPLAKKGVINRLGGTLFVLGYAAYFLTLLYS